MRFVGAGLVPALVVCSTDPRIAGAPDAFDRKTSLRHMVGIGTGDNLKNNISLVYKEKGRGLLRVPLILVESIILENCAAGLLDRPGCLNIDT